MALIPVSLTLRSNGILRQLVTDVNVTEAYDPRTQTSHPPQNTFKGIWDTGATGSVITQEVVDKCGLKPSGVTEVTHAHGKTIAETYSINIVLPSGMAFIALTVTKGNLGPGAQLLIGMDVISQGDFALTNKNGKTCFSFRVPSLDEIDYRTNASGIKPGSKDPCPCGSGKQFRKCCQGKGPLYAIK